MNRMIVAVSMALALALPAAAAKTAKEPMAPKVPGMFRNGILADTKKGMTLYVFDKDAANSGKSACNGPCAESWPPLKASAKDKPAGDWSVATRDDGKKQWAYKGLPVYHWKQDKKVGDTTGDNFKNVWHVVKEAK